MGCSAISQAVSLDCCCVTPLYIGLGGGLGHGWEPLCDPSLFGPVDPWRFADPSLLADCWRLVSVAAQNHWLLREICRPIVRPAVGLLQGETRKGAYKPFRVLAYIAASYDVPGFFFFLINTQASHAMNGVLRKCCCVALIPIYIHLVLCVQTETSNKN